jgi:hypothetical protein
MTLLIDLNKLEYSALAIREYCDLRIGAIAASEFTQAYKTKIDTMWENWENVNVLVSEIEKVVNEATV